MGKGTAETTQQSQSTQQLAPWAPAAGALGGILGALGPAIGGINGNPLTAAGFSALAANASNPNLLGPMAMNAAQTQLGGARNYGAATNTLTDAYGRTAGALAPYLTGSALDPSQNAALGAALGVLNSDVHNSVDPTFAAAGRLGSPDNYQAVARGIAQGAVPILQNAQTNQLNAINSLGSLAGATAAGLTGADAANSGILGAGIGNAATAYGAQNLGPEAMISAGTRPEQMAIQNASGLSSFLAPLAGMFGTQVANNASQGTQTKSLLDDIWGWGNMGANILKAWK